MPTAEANRGSYLDSKVIAHFEQFGTLHPEARGLSRGVYRELQDGIPAEMKSLRTIIENEMAEASD